MLFVIAVFILFVIPLIEQGTNNLPDLRVHCRALLEWRSKLDHVSTAKFQLFMS